MTRAGSADATAPFTSLRVGDGIFAMPPLSSSTTITVRPGCHSISNRGLLRCGERLVEMILREIDHVVLRVVDVARMEHFYCAVLGCTIERRQDEIGLIQLRAGRSLL